MDHNINNRKDLSKEHLKRIGMRFRSLRENDLKLTAEEFRVKLGLAGAVMTRLENGAGIQIFNLLTILYWLNEEGYNIKWFLLYDNSNEFKKNENSLALYSDMSPKDILANKEILKKSENIIKLAEEIKELSASES